MKRSNNDIHSAAQHYVAANCTYYGDEERRQLEDAYIAGVTAEREQNNGVLASLLNLLPPSIVADGKYYILLISRSKRGLSWSVGWWRNGNALVDFHRASLIDAAEAAYRWYSRYNQQNTNH